MKLLHTLSGIHRSSSLLRALGRRHFSVPAQDYAKRNYANNEAEYTTVIGSLTAQRRHYLLRDVYDDMMLDGVKPERDTFHSLIAGTMKGARLQDAFYFRDEMKSMGLVPDVALYNFLISTCGKCGNSDEATRIFEEMKKLDVKPTGQTFICLLSAYAATGRVDRVYAIVRDMTAAGLGLNKFCYAGLITAHKNKTPVANDTAAKVLKNFIYSLRPEMNIRKVFKFSLDKSKLENFPDIHLGTEILELVEQSKGWLSVEASKDSAENVMMGISEEELYNLPTAEYVNRRGGFIGRALTVYHAAFHAFADFKNVEAMDTLQEMLQKDGRTPDAFIVMQIIRCYLHSGDIDRGLKVFEEYTNSRKPPIIELYTTLVEGAMVGYTPRGMQIAQETLEKMISRNFFLSIKMGNDLLLTAAGETTGGYTVANLVWDMMQARKVTPSLPAIEAYYNGLKGREIPAVDPRLMLVSRTRDNLRLRFGAPPSGRP